jgi:acyl-coenzyme A synthetase/AMP-(fatty) acid ligase
MKKIATLLLDIQNGINSEDTAIMIYTSGTTGTSKRINANSRKPGMGCDSNT